MAGNNGHLFLGKVGRTWLLQVNFTADAASFIFWSIVLAKLIQTIPFNLAMIGNQSNHGHLFLGAVYMVISGFLLELSNFSTLFYL